VSPAGKSFRFVRSCVRARGLVVRWKSEQIVGSHPSLFPIRGGRFSLLPERTEAKRTKRNDTNMIRKKNGNGRK